MSSGRSSQRRYAIIKLIASAITGFALGATMDSAYWGSVAMDLIKILTL